MWTRSASCLKNERDQIDVRVPVEFGLLRSLGHKSWFCADTDTDTDTDLNQNVRASMEM